MRFALLGNSDRTDALSRQRAALPYRRIRPSPPTLFVDWHITVRRL